jgi:hypothetical protein
MSLLKGLRQLETAYQTKNWNLVLSAYEEIAGEPLEIQESDDKNVVAQRYETADFIEPITLNPKKRGRPKKEKPAFANRPISEKTKSSIIETKKKTGTEVKWSGNSFVDDGRECADDKVIDRKLSKGWKAPPKRPKHQYATVACKTCSQSFQVDPSVLTENPLCNRCLSKKARG